MAGFGEGVALHSSTRNRPKEGGPCSKEKGNSERTSISIVVRYRWGDCIVVRLWIYRHAILGGHGLSIVRNWEACSIFDGRRGEVCDFTNVRQMLAGILNWTWILKLRTVGTGSSGDQTLRIEDER